jgi:hypothetical protein
MANSLDDRRKGFESKWAHDEQLRFKVAARRNKLLGLWAASEMGISGAEADAYAKTVVASDFEEAGDEDVFRKVAKDLGAGKEAAIRQKMAELLETAGQQVMAEAGK